MTAERPLRILPVIVVSQLLCTSLWFAGNAVLPELIRDLHLEAGAVGTVTSSVQLGFIAGTLAFALLTIADRYTPARVFFFCALAGAACNAAVAAAGQLAQVAALRFLTGFFLAGIYPVGMKIAADHYRAGLGKALGFLVGALVLGTAFPHGLRSLTNDLPWHYILYGTSLAAVAGGTAMWLWVPRGPYHKTAQKLDLTATVRVFRRRDFRSVTLGYFGHMWELYAFWAFVPFLVRSFFDRYPAMHADVPMLSFLVIAAGGPACVAGGFLAARYGAARTAAGALSLSGLCCLTSPLLFTAAAPAGFLAFLVLWGMAVIADSPLFSTLVAEYSEPEIRGTALTIVNCIGFSITIVSIQLLTWLSPRLSPAVLFTFLAAGPAFGLAALVPGIRRREGSGS